MSDISKCFGTGCLIKFQCKRFRAPADPFWQSYIAPPKKEFYNGYDKIEYCEMFWSDNDK